MHSSALLTIAGAVLLSAAVVLAQDNYVDDYDQDDTPVRSHSPSFRRPSAPQPSGPRPAPVAILKQIDKHNDDGSYTYGYEGADGSFKIETKLVTGEVMGKYGYVDDAGKVRVVEYGANRYGFMPAGEGITVAPPTLVDETTRKNAKGEVEYIVDDGQYYREEAPAPRAQARPAGRPRSQGRPQHVHIQPQNLELPAFPEAAPAPQPAPRARPSSSGSPVPPRPQVPGAVPVFSPAPSHEPAPAPVYEQHHAPSQHRSFSPPPARAHAPQVVSRPPPPPPQQPSFASFDSWSDDSPAPAPVPVRSHRPAPPSRAQHARSSSSGILDQLERDYALPSGGRATHDISFGSF